jgi:hypothetical protein
MADEFSDLRTNERKSPQVLNDPGKDGKTKHPTHTQAATAVADDFVELFTLKAGEVVFPDMFFLSHSAWVATSTIDIGFRVHTDANGTLVAADPAGIATGIAGDVIRTGTPLGPEKVVESISFPVDVIITAQAKTAGIDIGDTMSAVVHVGQPAGA